MADNSPQILNDVLAQQRTSRAPEMSEADYFEKFCAEQILKDFNLSDEEIESGIVDGEHDGGADAIYGFVNGELISEDFDYKSFKKDVYIELYVIQSKSSGGFSEIPLTKLISLTNHLLKFDSDYGKLTQYSDNVRLVMDNFRQVYRGLSSTFPTLKIWYYYASKKADSYVHDNLRLKADELKAVAEQLFPNYSSASVEFLGARRLLDLARRQPKTVYDLQISKSLSAINGHVVLSTLSSYNKFLCGDGDQLRSELFESNVRDFQGDTEVNADIERTLKHETDVEFWWMNNGVTILASRATLNGDTVTIENPQIVNGLQTSTQIAKNFRGKDGSDSRNVMVKIVSSEIEETRDKIIKATNSQNAIQPATLRATDKIQRDIEETLKSKHLYYDRRKNHYKNLGKPSVRIISISLMAQAVMSIILSKPDTARARPSSLIKDNSVYNDVFSENFPINMYVVAAELIRSVDRVLKLRSELSPRHRSNLRFYVLYWLSCVQVSKTTISPQDIIKIDLEKLDDSQVELAIDEVWKIFESMGATDQIAKGPDLKKKLSEALTVQFNIQWKI